MKKALLLVSAAVSVVMFALPAGASAKSWDMDWNNGNHSKPLPFTIDGTAAPRLTAHNGETVECSVVNGQGEYTTTTTGSIQLVLHGCIYPAAGISCRSGTSPAGTIETTVLPFHNVYSTHNGKEYPGILVTPGNNEHFSSFFCTIFGIGVHFKTTGNGVIGQVEKCGDLTTTSLNFESAGPGTQTLTEWTGTTYDRKWSKNGGAPITVSQDRTEDIQFPETVNATCIIPA